jgi:hypothetical protein
LYWVHRRLSVKSEQKNRGDNGPPLYRTTSASDVSESFVEAASIGRARPASQIPDPPPLGQIGSPPKDRDSEPASENSHWLATTATDSMAPCASMRTPPPGSPRFNPTDPYLAQPPVRRAPRRPQAQMHPPRTDGFDPKRAERIQEADSQIARSGHPRYKVRGTCAGILCRHPLADSRPIPRRGAPTAFVTVLFLLAGA